MANCPGRAEFSPPAWVKSDSSVRGELSGSSGVFPLSEAVTVSELGPAPSPGPGRTWSPVDRAGLPGADGPSPPEPASSSDSVRLAAVRRVAPRAGPWSAAVDGAGPHSDPDSRIGGRLASRWAGRPLRPAGRCSSRPPRFPLVGLQKRAKMGQSRPIRNGTGRVGTIPARATKTPCGVRTTT